MLTASRDGDPRFERRAGERILVDAPAYYEVAPVRAGRRGGLRITYWLLYGGDDSGVVGDQIVEYHEGDWEAVEVVVRRTARHGWWMPVSLRHRPGTRPAAWRDVERSASHPVVYSARGSHTPYGRPGEHARPVKVDGRARWIIELTEACEDCAQWRTWTSLEPVADQPWHGFAGGWGLAWRTALMSGPLGPLP